MKRHEDILKLLQNNEYVNVNDLCQELKVSAVTIRKDLNFLENKGLLYRTHGGASIHNPYTQDTPVSEKEKLFAEEKLAIGKAAAELIKSGESIIIASGTTVKAFTKQIDKEINITAITASLKIAQDLTSFPNITTIQLGGEVRKSSKSVIGFYAESAFDFLSAEKLFIGVDGIDLDYGLTTSNMGEANLNKKMIEAAQHTIVLTDSSKFGKRGFGKICSLDAIHYIITDDKIPESTKRKLEEMEIKVIIVNS